MFFLFCFSVSVLKGEKREKSRKVIVRFRRFFGKTRLATGSSKVIAWSVSVMAAASPQHVTQLLADWNRGDEAALGELAPLVYEEMHRLAHRYMAGQRSSHTLQATALVNEAYLKLADQTHPNVADRTHFFAIAAQAMRQILVDYARASLAQKRGGGAERIDLDEAALVAPSETTQILDLHAALERLAALDSRKAEVVEMKYFAGMNHQEIADVLKTSSITVRRDWIFARAWLHRELRISRSEG